MNTPQADTTRALDVERWPSELPLFGVVVAVSVLTWLVLVVTIVGIFYAILIAAFLFLSHLVFVAHVRGSGVRLGPDQLPDIYEGVARLSREMGMAEIPEAYVVQAGGALNAFATRFLRRDLIVLYSDLLEACGDNERARDMIIGHELGHLKCNHLRWLWLIAPGLFVPFLGSALARAREYTCDRYGLAAAGNPRDAIRGLTILAAGPKFAGRVSLESFAAQRDELNTGLMTLAEWLSTHPPLAKRLIALEPGLGDPTFDPGRGQVRAAGVVAAFFLPVAVVTVLFAAFGVALLEQVETLAEEMAPFEPPAAEEGARVVEEDFAVLGAFIVDEWGEDGPFPESIADVEETWIQLVGTDFPSDPFDGFAYGFDSLEAGFQIWSSGPDGTAGTQDDLTYSWPPEEASGGTEDDTD